MNIVVIADKDTVTGFRLSGIKRTYLPERAEKALTEIKKKDDVGIVIITEGVADQNRDIITKINREKKGMNPIIIEVPDGSGPIKERVDPIKKLIKRVIGVEVG